MLAETRANVKGFSGLVANLRYNSLLKGLKPSHDRVVCRALVPQTASNAPSGGAKRSETN